jgi:hypothetical protein
MSGACAECLETLDNPALCPHVVMELPAWKDKRQQGVARAMYKGNEAMFAQESLGVVVPAAGGVFQRKLVDQLFAAPRFPASKDTRHVFVSVDPCGSGSSRFAVVSASRGPGAGVQIHGIENECLERSEDCAALLVRHVGALRALFASHGVDVCIVLVIESNLSGYAENLGNAVLRHHQRGVIRLNEHAGGLPGVLLTNERKCDYVKQLKPLLAMGAVTIADHVVSDDPAKALECLRQQLRLYREVASDTHQTSAFAPSRLTYSGKVDSRNRLMGSEQQDDLAIALQQLVYWSQRAFAGECRSFQPYAGEA